MFGLGQDIGIDLGTATVIAYVKASISGLFHVVTNAALPAASILPLVFSGV